MKFAKEIKAGIVIGILVSLWLHAEYFTGLHDKYLEIFIYVTNFVLLIPLVGLIVFLKKRKRGAGVMTFSEGFKSGLVITLIYALIALANQFLYHSAVNPDYFDFMIKTSVAKGESEADAKSYFNLSTYTMSVFGFYFLFGLVVTVITSLILKKKQSLAV